MTTTTKTNMNLEIQVDGKPVQINLQQSFEGIIADIRSVGDDIVSNEWFYLEATDVEVVFCRCQFYLEHLINTLSAIMNDTSNPSCSDKAHELLTECRNYFQWDYKDDINRKPQMVSVVLPNGKEVETPDYQVWLRKEKTTKASKALWEASF